ncbi:DUF4397 domain-containing protein [Mucilaginibacter ginsenosidivorax]|uniref:DUF4397 domain-containing protein n=1 Tax=Mucilaginibacter ginsenosidivorax TaxID=862126 RepID=A0A5B8W2G3_9SPHI|nr:DUF4397 domain-containing protein [Mucilaginibacter ginsenosidivorax]QEC78034.1 DUF4397 domain-containing protein [Mucilaginibacter ginsenosidivorax]
MNTRIKVLFFIAMAVACWASCKKSNDAPASTSTVTALVDVVNVSNASVNFYINGTRFNNTSTFYSGGSLGYLTVPAGTKNYSFKVDGASTPFYNKPFQADSATDHTIYIAGQNSDDVFSTLDTLVLDTASAIKAKYARVRFVNASASAGNMSFVLRGTGTAAIDTPWKTNIAFKTSTEFTRIKQGVHYIGIYRAAYPTLPKVDTVTLTAGKIYTFYGYGTALPAGNGSILVGLFNSGSE